MRSLRRSASPYDGLIDTLRAFLTRRATEVTGLSLLVGAACFTVALATWSIDDPSLNHATSRGARNLLGFGGAVVSDLGMQLLGLGALAFALPPAVWGMRLLRTHRLARLQLRLVLWIIGFGAASGMASALPPTARWPLPTGLGGVAGDALLAAAKAIAGPAGAFAGFLYAAVAVVSLTGACGFGLIEDEDGDDEAESYAPVVSRYDERQARRTPAPHDDESPGLGLASLGALAHLAMSARSAVAQKIESVRDGSWRYGAADPYSGNSPALAARRAFAEPGEAEGWDEPESLPERSAERPAERPAKSGRREPVFAEEPRRAAPAPRRAQPVLDDDLADDEDGAEPAPRGRVAPPPPPIQTRRGPAPAPASPDSYDLPALTLLAEPRHPAPSAAVSTDALEQNATLLESTLEDFGVRGEILAVRPGPVVTLYELEPAPGTKSSRVISLADDIARSMSAISARVAVVQGRNAIGIELPNAKRETVYLRELLASPAFAETKQKLALCLGKNIGGEAIIADLARMPHLLVAGTTGSGKSVAINTMILSLLYRMTPEECRLIMVDPKMLELSVYDGIPHLLSPVVTDPKKAVIALKWAVREMEERYKKMSKLGVRNIDGFNARVAEARARGEVITRTVQTGFDRETGEAVYEDEVMDLAPLPYIVIVVDEMADLMMVAGKDIEGAIQRLAQMARAAGLHLIMATQRPSVDVITGTIKANFPTRISFQVTSKIDSRTILGEMGAEQLLGQGDMLFMAGGG
ncbi:DNA translocase FtsK, partial [Methylobacterium sp. DB0501]